jgi:hypothetical protein
MVGDHETGHRRGSLGSVSVRRRDISKEKKGDSSSRLEASEEPAEDEEKREVVEKLKKREEQGF